MSTETPTQKDNCDGRRKAGGTASGIGAVYFMGFIGAAVYYIQIAPTAGEGFLGFLKAIVWPAFFVYDVLKFIHM